MDEKVSRRLVMKGALGLAGLAGCALTKRPGRTTTGSSGLDWIDAHVHVWTDDLARYPLAAGFTKGEMRPAHFTPEDLFGLCEPCGVRRINLIQMSYYGFDNSYMLDCMEKYPGRFRGTAVVDVMAADLAGSMRRLASRGVRAFRIQPTLAKSTVTDWLRPDGYQTMFRVGADENLAMSCLIEPAALPELDRMCARFPGTPVIIDHLCRIGFSGRIEQRDVDALCRMSRHKRIMIKVGAFYALGLKKAPYDDLLPLIRQVTTAFGPQRCMWETDCPFQVVNGTYEASLALVRDRCDFLAPADKEQILRKTAEDFFFHAA